MGPETECLPDGTWDQPARQEVTAHTEIPLPSMNRMTNASKNITLPQTLFDV